MAAIREEAVLAAGPFSREIAATAGVVLPVEAVRRHRAMVAPRPEIPADGPMTLDVDTHAYWRPEGGGAFLGQGLPEAPSDPALHVPVDWTFPAVVMAAAGRLAWRCGRSRPEPAARSNRAPAPSHVL